MSDIPAPATPAEQPVAKPARPVRAFGQGLRPLLPRGLLGRSLLIILLPLLILQGVALQLFYGNHLDVISRRLAGGVAGEIGMVIEIMQRMPDPADRAWLFRDASWRLDLGLAFEGGASLGATPDRAASLPLLPLEDDLAHAMAERVRRPFDADWQSDRRSVIIRIQLPDGVLHVEAPRKRLFTGTLYLFFIWLVGSSLLLFGVAALFMKNQVRAIRRLAGAAEAFGLGRDIGQMKPEGASEVRQAASAFNRMQDRIRRFIGQRTDMLAGISHDLRTPLTRMRLALAMLPHAPETEADVAALTEDVEEMERMIAVYLAFARGEAQEQTQPTDLAALVSEVARKSPRDGAQVLVRVPESLVLPLRPDALRRCLANLIDNARKHARRIDIGVAEIPRGDGIAWAQVTVDDDGPGIPEELREEAFRPFATLSAGGTGLGLAIARDIARSHGGDIVLEASPLGGLRARIRLPV
ncbi:MULTISPECIES: ATP-binding protein [Roseomonadaceae]|uniref:histidine kinase n=1 Tax=Falsiroseomonas oleicola TaxID=2801474 RepID=A0ABS6H9X3_9PROT|nr:ATP-binding protein [Roseomonas oleicola]MBU8545181.1 HAMP domain-containing protein [Roseomonas oleicola]